MMGRYRWSGAVAVLAAVLAAASLGVPGAQASGSDLAGAHPSGPVILTGPGDRTGATTATFTVQKRAGEKISARIDRRSWSHWTAADSVSFTRLRQGTHRVEIRLRSGAAVSRPTRARFVVDTVAPQTVLRGVATREVRPDSAIRFAGRGASRFTCQVDRRIPVDCSSPYLLPSSVRSGRHVVRIAAVDAAGNVDPTPVSRTVVVAADAPVPSLLSDDFESGSLAKWTVTQRGTGTALVATGVGTNTSEVATFTEDATTSSAAYARGTLDALVPSVTAAADVNVGDAAAATTSVPLLRLYDANGTRIVNVYRTTSTGRLGLQTPAGFVTTTTSLPLGEWHRISVTTGDSGVRVALDDKTVLTQPTPVAPTQTLQLGNEIARQAGSVSYDNVLVTQAGTDTTPPQTTITASPTGIAPGSTASIEFTSDDSTATFQCSLDGSGYTPCTSPSALTGLAKGNHTYLVRAVDPAGNVDPTAASATWTQKGDPVEALLIADNQNRRILITDLKGNILWRMDNPTGETSAYSGPLGVRMLPNGNILATFGTGKVGEIDVNTSKFVWITAGYNKDWFQSPYDAALMPDGTLMVATAKNEGGRVVGYNRATGGVVFKVLQNYAHLVEPIPAGSGTNTDKTTILTAGFSPLREIVFDPGQSDNGRVVWTWNGGGSSYNNIHRAFLDGDGHSIVVGQIDNLEKIARPTQNVSWVSPQGNTGGWGEVRGMGQLADGSYAIGWRKAYGMTYVRFISPTGQITGSFWKVSDGTRLNLIWGLRVVTWNG